MMQFFRKYQRYFFIFLTGIIVISFSFFGTYNALASQEVEDVVVFKDVSGKSVKRSTLTTFMRFLSSDADDKIAQGGIWGPNFLNDGVIKKDFLETGLALIIAEPFINDLKGDIDVRKDRQQNFKPYTHPYAKSLSAQNSWAYFAPGILSNLSAMKNELTNQEFFNTQVALYLEQDRFPAQYLKQVLNYQESQLKNSPNDPFLLSKDLSLFGYHNLEDWFGQSFLELSAQVIINGAATAKKQGIVVSNEEALAELLYNNEVSYRKLLEAKSQYLQVRNSTEYFQEQLRLLGIDQKTAIDIWKEVIAFRKLSNLVSNSVFVDSSTYEDYQKWASSGVKATIYEIPEELKLSDANDLKYFQTYIALTAQNQEDPLNIPQQFKSIDEIKALAPELVQKRYDINVATALASDIQMKAPIKEVWNWQLDNANWPKLMVKFSYLGTNYNLSREEKLALLDSLSSEKRLAIDNFTRGEILKSHQDWISDSLDNAEFKKVTINIKEKGSDLSQLGMSNPKVLQAFLDQYPLGNSDYSEEEKIAKEALYNYTENGSQYFRIELLRRENELSPLTFNQASKDGSLKILSEKNKTDISLIVDTIINDASQNGHPWHESTGISKEDFAAHYRFFKFSRDVLDDVKANNFSNVEDIDASQLAVTFDEDKNSRLFNSQFKLKKKEATITRNEFASYDQDAFYAVNEGEFSQVLVLPNIETYFFKVIGFENNSKGAAQLTQKAQKELSQQAVVEFMKIELDQMIAKKALNIERVEQKEGLNS
jgi:GcvH upstream region-like protein